MSNLAYNIIVLVACWALVVGAGTYLTFFKQPDELEVVRHAEEVARLKQAEVTSLLQEVAATAQQADEAVRKWRARYKTLPDSLLGSEVVGYFNDLTQSGFKNFDVALDDVTDYGDYSAYAFDVSGRAYYESLYRFIWALENNRRFYRIDHLDLEHVDLLSTDRETQAERMQVMVSFSMRIEAYFGGSEGVGAAETTYAGLTEGGSKLPSSAGDLPPVPSRVLPSRRPAINPFFPVVMERLPPNTHGLVNVEEASLVSIAGGKAVFAEGERGYRSLGEGEAVYLGHVLEVDPKQGRVVVRLNKGGIVDEVEIELHTGERYRQAIGPVRLGPLN